MPTSYEVDTFLGEVDTFFQKKTLYLPTKELLGNIPKNRIALIPQHYSLILFISA